MENLNATQLIESTLVNLQAVRWEGDEQVLYDYPSRQANPHLHFAFNAADLAGATQVTITIIGRGNNFRREDENLVDLHLTPLGVFPMDGLVTFLEGLASANLLK